ncbi:MAG: rhodanese-like domain-containing protein [Candidatus Hodarchaeota archaeon]
MRKIIVLSFLLLVIQVNPDSSKTEVNSVSHEELWSMLHSGEKPLVIDVRTKVEYQVEHVPTAINIPYVENNINQYTIEEIHKYNTTRIVTYCSCTNGYIAKRFAEELVSYEGLTGYIIFYLRDNFRSWSYQIVIGANPGNLQLPYNIPLFPLEALLLQFGFIFTVDVICIVLLLIYLKRSLQKIIPT